MLKNNYHIQPSSDTTEGIYMGSKTSNFMRKRNWTMETRLKLNLDLHVMNYWALNNKIQIWNFTLIDAIDYHKYSICDLYQVHTSKALQFLKISTNRIAS